VQHKRKIFLIDSEFQVRSSLTLALLIFVPSLIHPMVIFLFTGDVTDRVASVAPDLATELLDSRLYLVFMLVLWQMLLATIIFVLGVLYTHRVAGPLFKMQKTLQALADGSPFSPVRFRQGDFFHPLSVAYNGMVKRLDRDRSTILEGMNDVRTELEALEPGLSPSIVERLKAIEGHLQKVEEELAREAAR